MSRLALVLALLLALAGSAVTLGSPPGAPQERGFTLVAMAGGYNGSAPGPLLDVDVGDTVVVTLVNELAQNVSFHVHGMAIAEAMDGTSAHAGTQLVDSTAPPGGSFTYRFRAPYAGVWHYHDHAGMGESASGGFFGTIVVRAPGEARPASATDVHLLDGKCPTVPASVAGPAELDVTALGNDVWTASVGGAAARTLGPATSARFTEATPGTYAYSFTSLYWGEDCHGSVTVS